MNEQSCLSDLLEKGIQKMEALGIKHGHGAVNQLATPYGKVTKCCAIGAMLLGMGMELDTTLIDTGDAADWLSEVCPVIKNSVSVSEHEFTPLWDYIAMMNDGEGVVAPRSLQEILDWLKSQGL